MKENIILTKTFDFALQIIKYCELLHNQKKFVISNQLLKSGTSIGANIREAQNSESKNDFIHKFKISAKEIEELIKMSDTAEDAATKVKTFTQLIDTMKEAVQSGWTQTWELIFGDFNQAKEFFTGLSEMNGAVIAKSADSRNKLLGQA